MSASEASIGSVSTEGDKKPTVITFVNKKSGGQRGKEVIPVLKKVLGADRVFDLQELKGPEEVLKKFKEVTSLRVIACGGDGTIRWVIQGLINVGFNPLPPVGVLPLGTGNDLSRMFGWGSGYNGENLDQIVEHIEQATCHPMDIWNVSITPHGSNKTDVQIMFNYWNMGYDAQVALGFHKLRNSKPDYFLSRSLNKAWYFLFAADTYLRDTVLDIKNVGSLTIDGVPVDIPKDVKTIVVLNFLFYQAGTDIWGTDDKAGGPPQMDDKLVEVVGIQGILHEAQIRTSMGPGIRLGRGKSVQFQMNKSVSIATAFDGEPILQEPATITITHFGQLSVLQNIHATEPTK